MAIRNIYLSAILGAASLGTSFGYDFTKYIAADDPFPGGGTVDFMMFPVLSNGSIVVNASPENAQAEYIGGLIADAPALLIGRNTPIPGGTGNFETFALPAFWNSKLAFVGTGSSGQSGIYAGTPASLVRIADHSTLIPNGGGASFVEFNPQSPQIGINTAGDIAFVGAAGSVEGSLTGVYRSSAGTLTRVVDSTQFVPGSSTPFATLSNPTLTSTSTVFFGTALEGSNVIGGIYESTFAAGTLTPVAIKGQLDPEGNTLNAFSAPLAGGDRIVFVAEQSEGLGLYYSEDGILHTVFTTGMTIPGSAAIAENIVPTFSVNENGDIAFLLLDVDENPYVVAWLDGQYSLIADINTHFGDGTPLANPQALGIAPYQFSGDKLAVYAVTGPGEFGVYTTTVPEPGTIALLTIGCGAVLLRLRKRSPRGAC